MPLDTKQCCLSSFKKLLLDQKCQHSHQLLFTQKMSEEAAGQD